MVIFFGDRCEMGALAVYPNEPSPYYEFEMLDVRNKEKGGEPVLFLHFLVRMFPLFAAGG